MRRPTWSNFFGKVSHFVAVLAIAVVVSASDASKATAAENKVVMPTRGIGAHRGASDTHPENTLAAFREAIRLGAHQIEFDVRLTKDGHLVVMHDATVDRTTDGQGAVTDMTLAELRRLDAGRKKHATFAGERVPTLEETLDMMPLNIWLNCHLKGGAELGEKTARCIVRHGCTHQAYLACGRVASDAARKVQPDVLICNMEGQGYDERYVTDTLAHKDQFIQLLKGVAAPQQMARLKDAGVRINYCCTNDPAMLGPLFEEGVQFPMVDKLGAMMHEAQRLGIKPLVPVYRKDPPQ